MTLAEFEVIAYAVAGLGYIVAITMLIVAIVTLRKLK